MDAARETLLRLSRIVSNRCGIVAEVVLADLEVSDPPVVVALSRPARVDALTPVHAVNEGAGASLNRDRAMVKALGESIERYCAAFQPSDLCFASAEELGDSALPPAEFALFSADQYASPGFPFVPFTPRTRTQWVEGRALEDGRLVQVPASFVYLPYRRQSDESRLRTAISTGLAAGADVESATASALREVVERDAFMLVWRCRLPTPELDLKSLPAGPELQLVHAVQSVGARCHVRLLTQDIEIPVFLVILEGDGQRMSHAVVVGSGAHGSVRCALQLALEEVCLSLYGMNRLVRSYGSKVLDLAPADLTSVTLQSVAYAVRPELKVAAPFLFGPAIEVVTLAQLEHRFSPVQKDDLAVLTRALQQWGRHAAVVDCTTPDAADIGLHVIRVVVPALLPLDYNHAFPHLGGQRLRWGSADTPLNDAPHPFP